MATVKNGKNYCECAACGLVFGGVSGFDAHRVFMDKDDKGRYIEDWDRRRCLTIAELETRGYRQDANGYWGKPYGGTKQPKAA